MCNIPSKSHPINITYISVFKKIESPILKIDSPIVSNIDVLIYPFHTLSCKVPLEYNGSLNNLEKTDPSEIERTYNIRKQQTQFY